MIDPNRPRAPRGPRGRRGGRPHGEGDAPPHDQQRHRSQGEGEQSHEQSEQRGRSDQRDRGQQGGRPPQGGGRQQGQQRPPAQTGRPAGVYQRSRDDQSNQRGQGSRPSSAAGGAAPAGSAAARHLVQAEGEKAPVKLTEEKLTGQQDLHSFGELKALFEHRKKGPEPPKSPGDLDKPAEGEEKTSGS